MTLHPTQPGSPWHMGEKMLQDAVGVSPRMDEIGPRVIRDHMPEQHRAFFAQLPFLIAGVVDTRGKPWATMLEGPDGFVSSPDPRQLLIHAEPRADDPSASGFAPGSAIGLLGIELHTRRRNRLNGNIRSAAAGQLAVSVTQSFGNCPRYIQQRGHTRVHAQAEQGEAGTTLDARATAMIEGADTLFVASYAGPSPAQHAVDVSHRGGAPGFVRVQGNRLIIPDYAGNLFFNTLGNLVLNPVAGLLFVDFATGGLLQLSGQAQVLLRSPLLATFEGAERLWTLDVEDVVWRPGAVPLRWTARPA